MIDIGKTLIILGLLIALVGVILTSIGHVPWLGRLPGDIYVRRGNWSFYFPLATSLVLSVLLSLVVYLLSRR